MCENYSRTTSSCVIRTLKGSIPPSGTNQLTSLCFSSGTDKCCSHYEESKYYKSGKGGRR